MTAPSIERQAARYFWEQADHWRRQGDFTYAKQMDDRAADWARAADQGKESR